MAYKPAALLQTQFPDSTQGFLDSQKAYNDELSQMFKDQLKKRENDLLDAEKEQEELDKKMVEMAGKVVTPSTTNMFDSDYAVASQWADYLRDPENIDKFAESTEGMMEYNRLLSELNQFIAESQDYYATNFGTANDPMNSSTWSGALKRSRAMSEGVNVFDDQGLIDQNDEGFYANQLAILDDEGMYSFEVVDGQAMLNGGNWRDRELMSNPFMANLTVSGFTTGYNYYATEGASLANTHQTGEAAANWVESKIPSSEKLRRDIARSFDSENWKSVLEDDQKMEAATKAYLEDVKRAWRELQQPKEQPQSTATERENARIRKENREAEETMITNMLEASFKTDATVDVPTGEGTFTTLPQQQVFPVPNVTDLIPVTIDGADTQFKVQRIVFDNANGIVRLVGVDVENLAQAGGGATTGIETLVDLDIDPSTAYGQAVLSQLSLALDNTYGLTLEDLQKEAFGVDLRVVPVNEVNKEQQEGEQQGETQSTGAADNL